MFLLPGGAKSGPPGRGEKVTHAARRCGVLLNTRCGHHGLCSGCMVELVAGRFETGGGLVDLAGGDPVQVKGCLTTILSDEYVVRVPRRSLVETAGQIVSDFSAAGEPAGPLDPVVRRVELSLPEPRETNPASYVDQIKELLAARDFPGNIAMPLEVMREVPAAIRRGDGRIVLYVAHEPGGAGKDAGYADGWFIQDVLPPDRAGPLLGAAIDIGTTSVVVAVVDLESGRVRTSASAYNQQVSLSADVAQRIVDGSTPEGLRELRRLVVEESINPLLELCCQAIGAASSDVRAVAISANNVMAHLLLGISPESMGGAPFTPVVSAPPPFLAREVGIAVHPRAQARIAPAAGAYVGGDIVAGLEVLGYFEYPENALFIDIGTNGEMALSTGTRIVACATPAGPSFEGGGLTFGTRGAAGAIERIRIDPESGTVDYDVIGRVRPYGLCGSAYIDFLAEGLRSGFIDRKGRFVLDRGGAPVEEARVEGKLLRAYRIAPRRKTDDRTRDIVITEGDVATLLQAKAAIYAGAVTLIEHAGVKISDLRALHLGGGFAKHLSLENAIWTGLIPELPLERIHVVGNSSLAGSVLLLRDRHAWRRLASNAAKIEVVELNHIPSFEGNFVNALFLPNLDDSLFPNTAAALAGWARGRRRSERVRRRPASGESSSPDDGPLRPPGGEGRGHVSEGHRDGSVEHGEAYGGS